MMFKSDDEGAPDKMRDFMGPMFVDQQIRHAISHCWMIAPPEKKNVPAVEEEIRRIVERALKDLREDAESFGIGR